MYAVPSCDSCARVVSKSGKLSTGGRESTVFRRFRDSETAGFGALDLLRLRLFVFDGRRSAGELSISSQRWDVKDDGKSLGGGFESEENCGGSTLPVMCVSGGMGVAVGVLVVVVVALVCEEVGFRRLGCPPPPTACCPRRRSPTTRST